MEWEYRTLTLKCPDNPDVKWPVIDQTHEKKLNELGSDGWKLVSVIPVPYDDLLRMATYIFKRPREDSSWPSRV